MYTFSLPLRKKGVHSMGLVVVLATSLWAADKKPDLTPAKQMEIVRAVSPSLVTVEYRLKYDKSQAPKGGEVTYLCPNCSRPHTRRVGEELVKEERPLEEAGFLVSPMMVVSRDTTIADRFVESIYVVRGGERGRGHQSCRAVGGRLPYSHEPSTAGWRFPQGFGSRRRVCGGGA